MPSVSIDYTSVTKDAYPAATPANVVSTPLGLAIIEIQGELKLPQTSHTGPPPPPADDNHLVVDDLYAAIRYGNLALDAADSTKVTLFIGTSQRLLGRVVKLDPPLGVLRVSSKDQADVKMVDIIRSKIIFKDRPLPIM